MKYNLYIIISVAVDVLGIQRFPGCPRRSKSRKSFHEFDTDESGELSTGEVQAVLKAVEDGGWVRRDPGWHELNMNDAVALS